MISTDAGRYLCNYIFYKSLRAANELDKTVSIFIHVPPFEAVPKEQHFIFARDLLDELYDAAFGLDAYGGGEQGTAHLRGARAAAGMASTPPVSSTKGLVFLLMVILRLWWSCPLVYSPSTEGFR
eukprot:scaffold1541_cov256-Pinguiococcus_pyrenoidosus.AAC.24